MVHRPSDSRLLSNLISHEKDYSKQIQSLLDASHSSLASFSAFAAALPPLISQAILSVASGFSGSNEALGRYKDAVDAWREQLKALKDMEEEVSNIIRDREILVTRLLKASKNEKPPKDRERTNTPSRRLSILTQNQTLGSSSSLSLSLDHSPYNPNSPLPTSTKLAAAQAELQACEVHLANKEHELELSRVNAIRDGLRIRCYALIECGRAWGEMGKVALRTVENLRYDEGGSRAPKHEPHSPSPAPFQPFPPHIRSEIESATEQRDSSEFSSISPSQSASQVNIGVDGTGTGPPPVIPNAPGPILGINGSDIQPQKLSMDPQTQESPTPQGYRSVTPTASPYSPPPPIGLLNYPYSPYTVPLPRSSASLIHVLATAYEYDYNKIQIPPAHAIAELALPTVATKPANMPGTASGYLTPISNEGGSHTKPSGSGDDQQRLSHFIFQETKVEDLDLGTNVGGLDTTKEDRMRLEEGEPQAADSHYPRTSHEAERTVDATAVVLRASLNEGESESHDPLVGGRREVEGLPLERDRGLFLDAPLPIAGGSIQQTPKKSGFLGSLKGLFTGHHRGSSSADRGRERARERARGKEEKREEKVKEKEEKQGEKTREREEKREERLREQEGKTRAKQKRKEDKEHERQMRVLVPSIDSDDDGTRSEEDVFTSRHRRGSSASGGGLFSWGRKSSDAWTTRTDKNLSQIRRETAGVGDKIEGVVDGYVVKRNTGLQKNLRGIITGHHPQPLDLQTGREIYGDAGARVGGSNASLGSTSGSPMRASPGGSRLKKPRRISLQAGSSAKRSQGRREGRSASVPPEPVASTSGLAAEEKANFTTRNVITTVPASASHASPATAPTRALVTSNASAALTSGPAAGRETSTKKRRSVAPGIDRDDTRLVRETSVLGGTAAPAGMSTGLGGTGRAGRSGSVGVSVATPGPSVSGSHRRSASVSHGRLDLTASKRATIPLSGSSPSLTYQAPQEPRESLMSIVDSVTKNNRQAWGGGVTGSGADRTRGVVASSVHGVDRASISSQSGMKLDGVVKPSDVMGDVVRAPPRIERQALLASLKGSSGSPAGGQPVTTATTLAVKSPLKSALRPSRSPSPIGARAHLHESALVNGIGTRKPRAPASDSSEDEVMPMDKLTSLSSLPVEEHNAGRIPTPEAVEVGDGVRQGEGDDDDSASTSSYETGQENFESAGEEKRRGSNSTPVTSASPPLAEGQSTTERRLAPGTNRSVASTHQDPSSHSGVPVQWVQDGSSLPKSANSTPQRRKSVRVSLQPTFSPTPPAIEDEESEDGRAPFVWKENAPRAVKVHRSSSPLQVPKTSSIPKGREKHDIWQDSDDDTDYQTAKMLLQKTRLG